MEENNFNDFMEAWNTTSEKESKDVKEEPVDNAESFDVLTQEVAEIIPISQNKLLSKKNKKIMKTEEILNKACKGEKTGIKKTIEKAKEDRKKEKIDEINLNDFDELISENPKLENKIKKNEKEIETETEINNEKEIETGIEIDNEKEKKKKIEIKEGKIKFLLDSPSRLYDEFYRFKKELIEDCTPGKHLSFDGLTKELLNCKINIRTDLFDNREYIRQMTKIQNFMERVKNIQIICNNQYFVWEEFLPNLKGCLARVEYLKPAIKQEGFVHEHMRDLIWYYGKLKHLHESCKGVMKTLEKAFETISRKVSITTPIKSIEKYHRDNILVNKVKTDNYDNLPDGARAEQQKKNTDNFCEWEDIG